MRQKAKDYLTLNPVKPKERGLIDTIMFNMKYSILDYGKVGSKVKD